MVFEAEVDGCGDLERSFLCDRVDLDVCGLEDLLDRRVFICICERVTLDLVLIVVLVLVVACREFSSLALACLVTLVNMSCTLDVVLVVEPDVPSPSLPVPR